MYSDYLAITEYDRWETQGFFLRADNSVRTPEGVLTPDQVYMRSVNDAPDILTSFCRFLVDALPEEEWMSYNPEPDTRGWGQDYF